MDMRKFDIAMRSGWMRWWAGGECDVCREDAASYLDDGEEGYEDYVGPEAAYANVKTTTQLCSECFGSYVEDRYAIIEELPIP